MPGVCYYKVMLLPTEAEIVRLHRAYAPSDEAYRVVYGHCQIVAEIAAELAQRSRLQLDVELVRAGALLHDIGVYRLHDGKGTTPKTPYIQHGVLGAELLRQEGLAEAICSLLEHHVGVGLTREAVIEQNLPLPARDYSPTTPEERLVMYADKFHSKMGPHDSQFNSVAAYRQHLTQFGSSIVARFDALVAEYGAPDLAALAVRHHASLV
jgi:uncharacterized protein